MELIECFRENISKNKSVIQSERDVQQKINKQVEEKKKSGVVEELRFMSLD